MANKIQKKYKILLPLIVLFCFGFVNFTQAAVMDYIANVGLNTVLVPIDAISYLVGYIASLFVNIGGSLVNWSLTLNSQVLNSKTVEVGWTVTRDLANLGFVLAIILIAFATILRVQTYAMQQTLTRLITAALLINFSLVIAGVFVDFSGVLTNFFINKATSNNPSEIGAGLADAFQVQKLLWPSDKEEAIKNYIQGAASDFNTRIPFTASIVFVSISTLIVAMSLISLAAMLYIRYIWLTILLILMPIAWLFWIWPDLQGKWKEWWGHFMRWTFFAPAVTFFIYLALSIVTKENQSSIVAVGFQAPPGITLTDLGGILGRMLSVLGLLYGGLYTANAMGIAGANVGFAVAKGVKNAALGATVFGAGLAGRGALSALNTGFTRTFGKTGTEVLRGATAWASRIPVVGAAAQEWNRQLAVRDQERLETIQKDAEQMDPAARANAFKSSFDPVRQAALLAAMANKGELDKAKAAYGYDPKTKQWGSPEGQARFDSLASRAVARGGKVAKVLVSKDPHLAALDPKIEGGGAVKYLRTADGKLKAEYNEKQKEAVQKAIKTMDQEAISTMNIDLLESPEFLSQIKPGNLLKFAERGYEDQAKIVKIINEQLSKGAEEIGSELHGKLSAMAKTITDSPAWSHKPVIKEKSEQPQGPRSSTEPVAGINLTPPPEKTS